jgi:multimeric flavodoxin WrbA
MKVVAFNGSPRKEGNTYYALNTVGEELKSQGIDFEIVNVGGKNIRGCIACMRCMEKQNERCVIDSDEVNAWIQKMKEADGIILGSPVFFGGMAGMMKSFLDRAFFVTRVQNQPMLRHKVAAAVATVRRSGEVGTFNALNHYIMTDELIIPTSNYWNAVFDMQPGEAAQDVEGIQTMRLLGKNMAWLLKVLAAGKTQVEPVAPEERRWTCFSR